MRLQGMALDGVPVRLTSSEFNALGEYSCSLPTGVTVGKRWKRNANAYRQADPDRVDPLTGMALGWPAEWWLGEFIEDPDPKMVGIIWRPIELGRAE